MTAVQKRRKSGAEGDKSRKKPAAKAKPAATTPQADGQLLPHGATGVGDYLIQRLEKLGVRHIFGVPGDFVLSFYKMLEASRLKLINTTREDCAGFAADAYARIRGLGAVCVTYNVGGLSLCNSVAGAYAEKSPVVVISGAPGVAERANDPKLHHRVGGFSTQKEVFANITVASTVLEDRLTAFREIDRVLGEAVRRKGPVYIELPRDRVHTPPLYEHKPSGVRPSSDRQALGEALDEVEQMLAGSRKPIIMAGVELHRFGLQDELTRLVDQTGIPIAATLLGKSVIAENHPLYVGVYEGSMCRDELRQFVEESDCVLMLGCFLTDIDTGGGPMKLDEDCCVCATSEDIAVRRHHYQNVLLSDFMRGLLKRQLRAAQREGIPVASRNLKPLPPPTSKPITVRTLFDHINAMLTEDMVVIADVGDCLFGAADLVVRQRTEFVGPAYYTSMGFAIPGALGAALARPGLRQIVIVGDGAFQMTGTELSTIARHDLNPIVVVLNNRSYGTERVIQDGAFNDLFEWQYHQIPELLGRGWGCEVRTEQQFVNAMERALDNVNSFSILNVHLATDDFSPALERLGRRLSRKV